MKKTSILCTLTALLLAVAACSGSDDDDYNFSPFGSTSSSSSSSSSTSYSASDAEMSYITSGTNIATTDASLDEDKVTVTWTSSSVTVHVAENLADLVSAYANGCYVALIASDSVTSKITYTLSGTCSDGGFYMDGSYKARYILNDLNLTATEDNAAIYIQNGKLLQMRLADGTTNTLTDAKGSIHKACLMLNGHSEWDGEGSLTVKGNCNHAIWTDEYMLVEEGTITVSSAVTDGINVNQYYQQTGGTVTITASDEGIAVAALDEDDKDYDGQFIFNDGTLTITATSGKGIKSENDLTINGGTINVTAKGSEGIESKAAIAINDGSIYAYAYDDAINAAGGTLTIEGGQIYAQSSTNDGIDGNRNIYLNGGDIIAIGGSTSVECAIDAAEGYSLYINGGNIFAVGASSEATSSSSTQASIELSASVSGKAISLGSSSTPYLYMKAPTTSCKYVLMSCPSLVKGTTYYLKSGASYSGTTWNGLGTDASLITAGSSSLGSATAAYAVGSGTSTGGGTTPGGGGRW